MAPRNQVMSKRRDEIHQVGAPGHQNEAAVPDRLEVVLGHQFGARRFRGLHHHLVVADLAEQQKAAVLEHRYGRQGGGRQARPARFHLARLEAEFPGASDHVGSADRRGAALMANLRGIGPDAVEAQQHDQRRETWIIRPGYFRMCRHFGSHVPVSCRHRAPVDSYC